MENRLIGPKEFAAMLGVCPNTAKAHMKKEERCIDIGLGGRKHLRIPLDVAQDIVSGLHPLSSIEKDAKPAARPKAKKASPKKPATRYVPYR